MSYSSRPVRPPTQSTPDTIPPNSLILYDAMRQQWLYFHQPIAILTTTEVDRVLPLLETVQQRVSEQQFYAAGFVSYEASPAFDPAFQIVQDSSNFPLVWFGLYDAPSVITLPPAPEAIEPKLDWIPTLSIEQYRAAIGQIKAWIYQGLTYQVNFSFRLQAAFSGEAWAYFLRLHQAQQGLYSAFVKLPDWAICCASPELFFQLDHSVLTSRPMKGTIDRGMTLTSDGDRAQTLRQSAKNQAENLMIVDMIRNDMGRIAQLGTVQVPHLFELEQYPTLWQMTSTVQCQLPPVQAGLPEILRSLFPCASITGAPKPSTMSLIAQLESTPRRIYTGTIGFLTPAGRSQFNVAIRTVLVDRRQQQAEYGVGGGIVWDSETEDEFAECCTKAKILTQQRRSFELLETILWTPDQQYFLLDLHLERLQRSAQYFGFPLDTAAIQQRLLEIATTFTASAPVAPAQNMHQTLHQTLRQTLHQEANQKVHQEANQKVHQEVHQEANQKVHQRVRLRVSAQGELSIDTTTLSKVSPNPLRVVLATTPVHSIDPFLYHKTTNRVVYEQAKAQAQQVAPEIDEVLLWNERGELTEFCIGNLVVERAGQWYTPPVESGLLAGTFRAWLLRQGRVQERVLRSIDLPHCSQIFLVNSVRQMQPVKIRSS